MAVFTFADGNLSFGGRVILSDFSPQLDVVFTPSGGIFVGTGLNPNARHSTVPIGVFRGMKFMSSYRCDMRGAGYMMGGRGREIPRQTQFLLAESRRSNTDDESLYFVFLPVSEFRISVSLQGSVQDELQLLLESVFSVHGANSVSAALFIGSSSNSPFTALSRAVEEVESRLRSFRRLDEKRLPAFLDYFGWRTPGLEFTDIQNGVDSLVEVPPKLLLLQGVQEDYVDEGVAKRARKEYDVKDKEVIIYQRLGSIVEGKEELRLRYILLSDRQPGVPSATFLREPDEEAKSALPLDVQELSIEINHTFDLLAQLSASGVHGLLIDPLHMITTLRSWLSRQLIPARVALKSFEESVKDKFGGNQCIYNNYGPEVLYCSHHMAIARASSNVYPEDPALHVSTAAYCSFFLGEFMVPDWDCFSSCHLASQYYAAALAISGGPVLISDSPGEHNISLLKKLVLPNGTILRCQLPGRPTRDCLFVDPRHEGKSLLKVWNANKYNIVIGIFNCQGAGDTVLTCHVSPSDAELRRNWYGDQWKGDYAVYYHKDGKMQHLPHGSLWDTGRDVLLPKEATVEVSLKTLDYEMLTLAPVQELSPRIKFAPLGLLDMLNGGGAVFEVTSLIEPYFEGITVFIQVKGCGRFGAYCSQKPAKCFLRTLSFGEILLDFTSEDFLLSFVLEDVPGPLPTSVHTIGINWPYEDEFISSEDCPES